MKMGLLKKSFQEEAPLQVVKATTARQGEYENFQKK